MPNYMMATAKQAFERRLRRKETTACRQAIRQPRQPSKGVRVIDVCDLLPAHGNAVLWISDRQHRTVDHVPCVHRRQHQTPDQIRKFFWSEQPVKSHQHSHTERKPVRSTASLMHSGLQKSPAINAHTVQFGHGHPHAEGELLLPRPNVPPGRLQLPLQIEVPSLSAEDCVHSNGDRAAGFVQKLNVFSRRMSRALD